MAFLCFTGQFQFTYSVPRNLLMIILESCISNLPFQLSASNELISTDMSACTSLLQPASNTALWDNFENTAQAIAALYRSPNWSLFQHAAAATTQLYKGEIVQSATVTNLLHCKFVINNWEYQPKTL